MVLIQSIYSYHIYFVKTSAVSRPGWSAQHFSELAELLFPNARQPGYAYCVGTTDDNPTRSNSSTTSTTHTSGAPAPTKTQENNAPSNCNGWAEAQAGDYCSLFAERNDITLDQLFSWNAVLGSDSSGCDTMF